MRLKHSAPSTLVKSLLPSFAVLAALSILTTVVPGGAAQEKGGGPTPGSLQILDASGKPRGFCPLRRTDVRADVAGFIARVNVTQEFENPFDEKIEAVYTFPLPHGAA